MPFFRLSQNKGIRFVSKGAQIDVAPSEVGKLNLNAIEFTQVGSRLIVDVGNQNLSVGNFDIETLRATVSGRTIRDIDVLDGAGRLLFDVGDFSVTAGIAGLFPLNRGDDFIRGAELNDQINAGRGSDRVQGKDGDDRIKGGGGNDVLIGGRGEDLIFGNGGADTLRGGAGDDDLRGGGGLDRLSGGGGDDNLNGGAGQDFLIGGGGDDTLAGARGDDTLKGGQGEDTFVFSSNDGADVIRDFQQGLDLIQINGAGAVADLRIDQIGDDAVVAFGNLTITIEDQNADLLGAADFIF